MIVHLEPILMTQVTVDIVKMFQASDIDEAPTTRSEGSWRNICEDFQNFIAESCDNLVTSDGNALTDEGKMVLQKLNCLT